MHYKFANKNNENQAIGERKKFDWLNPATRGLLHYEKASEWLEISDFQQKL